MLTYQTRDPTRPKLLHFLKTNIIHETFTTTLDEFLRYGAINLRTEDAPFYIAGDGGGVIKEMYEKT